MVSNTPQAFLKSTFGYSDFRPLQKEVIENVLARHDTLVIMPTGGGKSICYQIPALIFSGLTIVVSPLISLMKDQVEQLQDVGVSAEFLNSSLTLAEYNRIADQVRAGSIKLLYVAPEGLLTPRMFDLLKTQQIDCLTIDEAHCISEWGHDFRPEYRQLAAVRGKFPDAVCIALTATATPRVRQDIMQSLNFDKSNEFIASFNRENLYLEVVQKSDPARQTIQFLEQHRDQSGIIYCFSRRQVDELAAYLAAHNYSVLPYHAGLSDEERKKNQELFIRDDVQIIVATIAFGMGINKPNVRFVIHFDLPKNIESYYQEIGRAGRDGLPADCLLLFSYGDLQKIRYFIDQKEDEQERRNARHHLDALVRYAESDACRRAPLLTYFGEHYTQSSCDMCDNCLQEQAQTVDITIAAQKFLSCVKRTREIFGANHIIDVLRGSENKKVLDFGHHHLSTYAIGREYSKEEWLFLARQFISQDLLVRDVDHGSLKITEKGTAVLFDNAKVYGRLETVQTASHVTTNLRHDPRLFEILRAKRKEIADRQNVPPYVIFSDRSLVEMATFFPQSRERFLAISGVGLSKLNRYGSIFLRLIQGYCEENQIEEKRKSMQLSMAQIKPLHKRRFQEVGEAFCAGKSVGEIAGELNIKKTTVIRHLFDYVKNGNSLPADQLLVDIESAPEQHKEVFEVFHRLGTEFLSPVHDALNGRVTYDDLHLLRIYLLCQKAQKSKSHDA
ncbi:DNA helicase RecQ [candidate division KSB1 bacterium]|nr:DNA helicase RecQ [candidate division KSB1 bacterium]RQW03209.1 MAG: DNA helicase RecQ [candidate division KSB1 bacterium]